MQKSASSKEIQDERMAKVMKKSSSDIRPRKTAAFGTKEAEELRDRVREMNSEDELDQLN